MCYIRNQIGGIKVLKKKIEEFVLDIKPEMEKCQAEEFSKELAKEIVIVSSILLGFTIIGVLAGVLVEIVLNSNKIPFYILGLLPWLTGTLGGIAVYHCFGPKTRALLKKHLGS